jgi:AraC-like DNA-binding protein
VRITSQKMGNSVQKRLSGGRSTLFSPIHFKNDYPVCLNPHSDPAKPVVSMSYHDAFEVSLCTKGSGVFFIEDEVHAYREGTLVLLSPNTFHISHGETVEPPEWVTLYVSMNQLAGNAHVEGFHLHEFSGGRVMDCPHDRMIRQSIGGLAHELSKTDGLSRLGVHGYLQVLLVELSRMIPLYDHSSLAREGEVARLAPVLNYIASNLDKPLPVSELAKQVGMSESHFRRNFTRYMGQSPHRYVLKTRIQLAKGLLRDPSISVLEVAGRCGFDTLSTFNRAFKKDLGMSPREWRAG